MGLNKPRDFLYLNVSKGFLKNKKQNIQARSYTGTLVGIKKTEDEFEGKKIPKIELRMKDTDSDQVASIKFGEAGWYSAGFFCRANGIDVTKPFELGVSQSDQSEKISFCWIKQNNRIVPADKTNFPKPNKTTVNKETVTDWTPVLEVIPKIMEKLLEKMPRNYATQLDEIPTVKSEEDDLPF